MLIFSKIKTFAQMVGFATIGILAVYGGITVLNSAKSVWAAEPAAQVAQVSPADASAADPGVPYLVNYQGTLRDREGNLLSGSYTMTLRIYDDVTAATADVTHTVYAATYPNVTVRDGHFSVILGNKPQDPLKLTLFTNPNRFIGITVAGFDEMQPRQRFASVPYAIQADHAFALGGKNSAPYTAVWVDQGKVQIGNQESAAHPVVTADDDAQVTVENQANNRWGMLVTSTGGGSAKGLKIKTAYQGHPNVPLFLASAGYGANEYQRFVIEANGNVGIGVPVPQTKLDILGNGAPQIRFGDSNGYWELWGGGNFHLRQDGGDRLTISKGNVSIPTGSLSISSNQYGNLNVARDATVGGSTTVNGGLTVGGEIRGKMKYTNVYHASSGNGETVPMISASQGFCFLAGVRGVQEAHFASVSIENGNWQLATGAGGVEAWAYCVGVDGGGN